MVQGIAEAANIPIESIDSDVLSQTKYAKTKTVEGRASWFFTQIAADHPGLQCWISPQGLNIRSLAPKSNDPDVVYGPPFPEGITVPPGSISPLYAPTLIGTPQLTEQGATWRVLMDSTVKIGMLAQLQMTVMRQLPIYPGQLPSAALLNQDRLFVVAGVRHVGDTRGNEWYTEIIGVTKDWAKLFAGTLRTPK